MTKTESAHYMSDPDLASALSKIAALQGHAVPAFRFGMLAQTNGGVLVEDLTRLDRASYWWSARFASSEIKKVDIQHLERKQFPALWLSQKDSRLLVVRGISGQSNLLCEAVDGKVMTLHESELVGGDLLTLTIEKPPVNVEESKPKSAQDWFAYAIRKHRRIFVESVFATFVVSMIGLVSALYSMQVYDRVIPTKGYSTLWVLTIGAILAVMLELVMKQVRAHMVDRACKSIDQELSAVFFGKALEIRMDARPKTVGTFASQIRYFESVRNFMTSSTLFVLADVPFALFFIGVMAMIAGPVALVPLVMVPIAALSGLMFKNPIEHYTAMHMTESNRKNGMLIEAIDGIESIKAAHAEWKMLDHWKELTERIGTSEIKMKLLSTLSTNLTQTIQQVSYVAMIAAGAYAINAGNLTMGGLIACSIISGRALSPLSQIPGLIVQWQHAKIALKSLDVIMAMPSDRESDIRLIVPEKCYGTLKLDKVGFAYAKDNPTLEVSALEFKEGERVAILGAVGSGKSTLIKLLSGLYKPSAGTVSLDGIDMTLLAPEFVREHIGYLSQDVRLFNGSLRENLTLGLPLPSDSQILKACEKTGLSAVIQGNPKGLELEISEGGRGLSGGQKQLVGLTRMLLAQPKILLLDEPTASMDAQLETRVMSHLFDGLPTDTLTLVVTHKLGILPHVSRIIVLDRGRIVIDGPREEVLARLRQPSSSEPTSANAGNRTAVV
jgi:ATP-binding cassette subfamily C protein LapB